LLLFPLVAVLVLAAGNAFGLANGDTAKRAPETGGEPFVFFNRTVFVFRAPILSYTPQQRVEGARAQLELVIRRGGDGTVAVKPIPEGFVLEVDAWPIFRILPGDVNPLENEKLDELAEKTRARVQDAMDASRESRSAKDWARSLVRAGIATLIWLVALRILLAAKRWAAGRFSELLQKGAGKAQAAGLAGLRIDQLRAVVVRMVGLLSVVVGLFLTYGWLTYALEQFAYTRPWGEHLQGFLINLLGTAAHAIVSAVPGLVVVVLIFLVTRALSQLLRAFFLRIER
jgi:hypothetical protein